MKGEVFWQRLQGPAQTAGVMVGWFLDLGALLQEDDGGLLGSDAIWTGV